MQLPLSYFQHNDPVFIARDLIGKLILRQIDGQIVGGIIIETEAYKGPEDRACHAYNSRRTPRTEVMYKLGGCCYIYQCYGLHFMLNIVSGPLDHPHAILIRSFFPVYGLGYIQAQRGTNIPPVRLAAGPGCVAQALGLNKTHNALKLTTEIWVEDRNLPLPEIQVSPRIGIDYAGEHRNLPWRFYIPHKTIAALDLSSLDLPINNKSI